MAKKMKKFMSMALVLCMMASMLSVGAFAADGTVVETEAVEGGTIVTTTTTNTDANGNTTVTVKIEENTSKTDSDGKDVTFNEVYEETTVTNPDGLELSSNWEVNGKETSEWTEEDSGDAAGQSQVDVSLVPGETTTGTAGVTSETVTNADGSVTTTTTTDRTVTAETSKTETTITESELLEDKDMAITGPAPVYDVIDGVKEDKGGMFDYQFNSGETSKYAKPSYLENMPEGADVCFVGTGEHSRYYVAMGYVVYEKDENGNTIYDENGEAVIKELRTYDPDIYGSSSKLITIDGEAVKELPDGITLEPIYDNYGGSRPFLFMMMDKNGNKLYGYCCDLETDAGEGKFYTMTNLEDSDYYASEESEQHIRSILMNGYWGTTDIPKADGSYEMGSLEGIKQQLREAINSGKMENSVVQMESTDADGNPVIISKTMLELIDTITAGEALLATQAAVWSFSNGSYDVQNGKDGSIILDPDGYKWNHKSGNNIGVDNMIDDFGSARIDFLYSWLIALDAEEDSTVVINDKTFVEDVVLSVGDKAEGFDANKDDDKTNDVYNVDLNFKLAFIPGDKDDLLVQITYKDLDGNTVNVVKRLAGTNGEGQSYEDIKPEADGSYVLRGLKLSENEDFEFDLRLEGTQYLENGVYLYAPVGGRDVSQTFVGVAQGERNVDVSVGVTVKFDVDENNHVVAERTWHDDGDPVNEFPGVFAFAVHRPLENIPEEEVPLADAPQTGDEAIVFAALTLLAGISLMAMHVSEQKRKEEV